MDRFVVGTGRCGSTLLSRMLGESPEVASLFEFFNGLDMTRRFGAEPIGGVEFAELISQPHPFVTMVLSRGYEVPEIVYPFGPRARFARDEPLPWLLVSLLSRASETPDALYDETLARARTFPEQRSSARAPRSTTWASWHGSSRRRVSCTCTATARRRRSRSASITRSAWP